MSEKRLIKNRVMLDIILVCSCYWLLLLVGLRTIIYHSESLTARGASSRILRGFRISIAEINSKTLVLILSKGSNLALKKYKRCFDVSKI